MTSHDNGRAGTAILVVDDDSAVARALSELLALEGYRVAVAADGAAALAQLADPATHFDILLTDQTMPRLSGTELISRARERSPGLRAVLMTGYSASTDAAQARASGIDAFLYKPTDPDELVRVLDSLRCGQDPVER